MRCKVGDLAVIVRSRAGNEGLIVTCLEFLPRHPWWGEPYNADAWRIDRSLKTLFGESHHFVRADWLRPIRDQPGTDETLTWAGKPQETPLDVIRVAKEMQ